jgi:undecaprenyl diphosphate synthase
MKLSKVPTHVGIIMDGNGRWATKSGHDRNYGHQKGAETALNVIEWSKEFGINYLTLYTFSEENWKRPQNEIEFLFDLLIRYFEDNLKRIIENGVNVRFLGRISKLPESLIKTCKEIEDISKNNKDFNLIFALNYSGRQEIVDAVNKFLQDKKTLVTKEDIDKNLYLPDVPYPDLIIRTAGEQRLSNFLLWQSAYSELYFTETLWPDFSYDDYFNALLDYSKRERRFGGISIKSKDMEENL